jgi:hypothetical protein
MKLRLHNYLQLSAVLTAMTMTGAYAQSAVSQSFTGTSLPSGFTTTADPSASETTAITFSSAGADFSGSDRNYIITSGTDYISGSFSASINVTNNSGDGAFLGLGSGAFGDFSEPGSGGEVSIYLRYTNNNVQILTGGPFGSDLYNFTTLPPLGDPVSLGLTYNATADDLVFSLTDTSTTNPSTETSTPIMLSGTGTEAFTASNSAIFFGGSSAGTDADPVFTNLSITTAAAPEPQTWAFLALSLLLGIPVWRARRLSAQS